MAGTDGRLVLTTGTFDVLHAGHISFLNRAAKLGDELRVGLLSDSFVSQYKGETVFKAVDRRYQLELAGFHTETITNFQTQWEWIEAMCWGRSESILAVGHDWYTRDYMEQIGCDNYDAFSDYLTLAFLPRSRDISTTLIGEAYARHHSS